MSRTKKIIGTILGFALISAIAIGLIAVVGISRANAENGLPDVSGATLRGPGGSGDSRGGPGGGDEALAKALGITVDELAAARGQAMQAAVAQALADGLITEEQAGQMTAGGQLDPNLHKLLRPGGAIDLDTHLAEALGISADELRAARVSAFGEPGSGDKGLPGQGQPGQPGQGQPATGGPQQGQPGSERPGQGAPDAQGNQGGPEGQIDPQRRQICESLSGYLNPQAILSGALGMTVEELQAAQQSGRRLPNLIEAQGLTQEEFRGAMQAAEQAALQQALADGAITQEQVDYLTNTNGPLCGDPGQKGPGG